jgi:transcription antitermination factor NusG
MINTTYDGKPVTIDVEFEQGEGVAVLAGKFDETGVELTEEQCLEIEESQQTKLYEDCYSSAIDYAEYQMGDR